MIFWTLFHTFFVIGMFTFGGGYAILSLIQNKVVVDYAWMTVEEFTDIVAISQMSPGPIGINSATYLGYTVVENLGYSHFLCLLGSLTATFAVVLPSFIVVIWICILFNRFKTNIWFTAILKAIKPAVIAMIGSAAFILITPDNFIDWKSWAICATAFCLSFFLKLNPIYILIGGGVVGYLIY
jgi:chromate transporter